MTLITDYFNEHQVKHGHEFGNLPEDDDNGDCHDDDDTVGDCNDDDDDDDLITWGPCML